ncbi:sulfurtransferase [Brevibacterium sp. BRM-1]|uniref:sulfurtransferase n=1 Tax=Brevibacterium sp. BRM-1 TaxID=2999062 RepID=UPI00227E8011|nr:sulfurtransferase [Brevibacterium sp. BRM-1]WAL40181.1 sulfurtransferase [Brevibacterium sp. BRM-1]
MTAAPHTSSPLLAPAELAALLESPAPPIVLDVRWSLAQPDGRADWAAGHIPGAAYVSMDDDLASPDHADPTRGRHPLPDPADLEAAMRRWGIDDDSAVVVYDDNRALGAARAWWLLRWAGLSHVRVLDGGLRAWRAGGHPLETAASAAPGATDRSETPARRPGSFTIRPGALPTLTADAAAELARTGVLLDARAGERYRGETEPLDARAGHIPGALNRPATDNTAEDTHALLRPERLRADFARLGAVPAAPAEPAGPADQAGPADPQATAPRVGVYCGSGVTACHNALALAVLGETAALYPASWSGWSADPDRPAATGPQ